MRGSTAFVLALLCAVVAPATAIGAEIRVVVDKSTQRMTVSVDGVVRHDWPVSTGMTDYATPVGAFTPSRLARRHFSREWDNAPMPNSIFFTDAGHAIHGSSAIGRLGTPASHGCVRLAPANASVLFNLVTAEGLENTRIEITGVEPVGFGGGGRFASQRDYGRLTSFDPLVSGIMVGGGGPRSRSRAP
jgi:hypothetical protein